MFESEKHFSDQLKDESRGKRFTLTADWSQSRISLCWMFLEASCRAARPRQLNYCDLALFVLSEVHSGHLCLCAHQIGVKFPSGLIISPVCVPTHTHTQTHTHTHTLISSWFPAVYILLLLWCEAAAAPWVSSVSISRCSVYFVQSCFHTCTSTITSLEISQKSRMSESADPDSNRTYTGRYLASSIAHCPGPVWSRAGDLSKWMFCSW